ncbi:MAG: dephospho-CoA kinase [Oscillospiraceae bacterium]|nr:dephospho-CoA kinase [Oscillospiraceae bacterium]
MTVIGITGPTGAGKTTALQQLEKMGALIIDCDTVYHSLLEQDMQLRSALEARFGDLTGPHGGFDRKKLGTLVFGDPKALEDLNAIVRPHIARAVERLLERGRKEGRAAAAVDGITIIESGLADRCDTTVAVLAPVEERVRRICQREGISRQYAEARVSAQKQDEYFRANCEHILMNDCARVQEFAQRAQTLFEQILNGIS